MQQETQPVTRRSLISCVIVCGEMLVAAIWCILYEPTPSMISILCAVWDARKIVQVPCCAFLLIFYWNDLWYPEMKAVLFSCPHCFLMEWVVVFFFIILIPSKTKPSEMLVSIESAERHFIHHLSVWLGSVIKCNTKKLKKNG